MVEDMTLQETQGSNEMVVIVSMVES